MILLKPTSGVQCAPQPKTAADLDFPEPVSSKKSLLGQNRSPQARRQRQVLFPSLLPPHTCMHACAQTLKSPLEGLPTIWREAALCSCSLVERRRLWSSWAPPGITKSAGKIQPSWFSQSLRHDLCLPAWLPSPCHPLEA